LGYRISPYEYDDISSANSTFVKNILDRGHNRGAVIGSPLKMSRFEKRFLEQRKKLATPLPGPGHYTAEKTKRYDIKTSFATKVERNIFGKPRNIIVGPGKYEMDQSFERTSVKSPANIAIGKASRTIDTKKWGQLDMVTQRNWQF